MLEIKHVRVKPNHNSVLLAKRDQFSRVFVIGAQGQEHRSFIYDIMTKKLCQAGKGAAPLVACSDKRFRSAPIVVHKPYKRVAQLRTPRDLIRELDGTFVGAHNHQVPRISSAPPQAEEERASCHAA